MQLALVNNMPDAAFVDAERQFAAMMRAGAARHHYQVAFTRYTMAEVARRGAAAEHARRHYRPIDEMWSSRPEAVIVTGAEPFAASLTEEPCWDVLARLFGWASASTSAMWLSCLAAHAALLAVDGVARRPLPAKCTGVFAQQVDAGHPLASGVGERVQVVHSRLNDVPTAALRKAGYEVAISSAETGWTLASAERRECLFVVVQGHPEYEADTLLREYRRDVRRYLNGQLESYPVLPSGYLEPDDAARFERFGRRVTHRDPAMMDRFPFEPVLERVRSPWATAAARLAGNWLVEVRRRTRARGATPAGSGRKARTAVRI